MGYDYDEDRQLSNFDQMITMCQNVLKLAYKYRKLARKNLILTILLLSHFVWPFTGNENVSI